MKSLLDYAEEAKQLLEEPVAAAATQEVRSDPARWVGRRLGSYEVLAPLGAGGMGEVYRAKDTKLEMRPSPEVSRSYSAMPDGRRFLVVTPVETADPTPLTVVLNWPKLLKD